MNIVEIKAQLARIYHVIPERIAPYNNGYLIEAYPKGMPEHKKQRALSPFYLYDSETNKVGPYSPAFDFDGFFKAMDHMKKIT